MPYSHLPPDEWTGMTSYNYARLKRFTFKVDRVGVVKGANRVGIVGPSSMRRWVHSLVALKDYLQTVPTEYAADAVDWTAAFRALKASEELRTAFSFVCESCEDGEEMLADAKWLSDRFPNGRAILAAVACRTVLDTGRRGGSRKKKAANA